MSNHPYTQYEETDLWKIVDKTIRNLELNKDIEVTTSNNHVVGYICEQLDKSENYNVGVKSNKV